MKRAPDMPDSARKKLVGEHLRNADKLLKSGEYDQALAEVEESLALEPGNFYAQAYKERIGALREKHGKTGAAAHPAAAGPAPRSGLGAVTSATPSPSTDPGAPEPGELSEATGARIEQIQEIEEIEEVAGSPRPEFIEEGAIESGRAVAELKEQLDRERATQEDETRRQAEELARRALETELREREGEGRLRTAEHEATTAALAAAPAEALKELVGKAGEAFEWRLGTGDLEGAFGELAKIGIVQPGYELLAEMTARLDTATLASVTPAPAERTSVPREIPLQWYGRLLRSAWSEGTPNRVQSELLAQAKIRFGVNPEEEKGLLPGIRKEIALEAVKEAYKDAEADPETRVHLEKLVRELSAGDIEALRASIMK